MLVRFVAAALMSWALVEVALYWAVSRHNNTDLALLPCLMKAIPSVIGLVILIKAKSIASWISEKLDE